MHWHRLLMHRLDTAGHIRPVIGPLLHVGTDRPAGVHSGLRSHRSVTRAWPSPFFDSNVRPVTCWLKMPPAPADRVRRYGAGGGVLRGRAPGPAPELPARGGPPLRLLHQHLGAHRVLQVWDAAWTEMLWSPATVNSMWEVQSGEGSDDVTTACGVDVTTGQRTTGCWGWRWTSGCRASTGSGCSAATPTGRAACCRPTGSRVRLALWMPHACGNLHELLHGF